ncbi:uncharacterized protein LOC124368547 [Homalodisca vitripennis]|uniref:uncharacterized protein LOC124368547 n=1 Tax=Homalodisca vitripennis TaxID=197043 RepID=UPI001EEC7B16|nr:uncharacterized protein LOC124368547 [Homalodisca vitripennis]
MTSFGATKIVHNEDGRNFESTFKIQGQVYHQIGSLLPMPDADPKFLQIYFMGDEEQQTHMRCVYNHMEQMEEREIVDILETFFLNHNQLLRLFKTLSNRLEYDNYVIVIKADKVPHGEHAGTYNVPTLNEVAVVMAGDPCERRDIRIQRRDNTMQIIQDNHRSYDALQYPLIFWEGEDGYHLNIKQRNPTTGEELIKKVSAMNFYAYRLMIRANEENHILRCRQLFHQYVVDMYVKIESERLRYIKFNQVKLRSEEYIHLRDAVIGNVDATNDINNIGTAYILPSSYIGSPRHMQEYIQDAMTYVRAYGRPDLFITFTLTILVSLLNLMSTQVVRQKVSHLLRNVKYLLCSDKSRVSAESYVDTSSTSESLSPPPELTILVSLLNLMSTQVVRQKVSHLLRNVKYLLCSDNSRVSAESYVDTSSTSEILSPPPELTILVSLLNLMSTQVVRQKVSHLLRNVKYLLCSDNSRVSAESYVDTSSTSESLSPPPECEVSIVQ